LVIFKKCLKKWKKVYFTPPDIFLAFNKNKYQYDKVVKKIYNFIEFVNFIISLILFFRYFFFKTLFNELLNAPQHSSTLLNAPHHSFIPQRSSSTLLKALQRFSISSTLLNDCSSTLLLNDPQISNIGLDFLTINIL